MGKGGVERSMRKLASKYSGKAELLSKIDMYNKTPVCDYKSRGKQIETIVERIGDYSDIIPPVYVNEDNIHINIGSKVFINLGLTIQGDGYIYIGDNTMLGSHVSIITSNHFKPISERKQWYCKPITIENDVWIGSNVTILPNIKIGRGSIIGAGSVVTGDIPSMCIAVGNPCKVIKYIYQ